MNKTILIVDDERNVVNSLNRVLRNDGHLILTATRIDEAITLFKEHDIDLVISDYDMSEMKGGDLLTELKAINSKVKMLLISGNSEPAVVLSLMKQGIIERFIPKPWDNDGLRKTVSAVLA